MLRYWTIAFALVGIAVLAMSSGSYAAIMSGGSPMGAEMAEQFQTVPSDVRVSREPHRECAGDCEPAADTCIGLSSCTVVGIVSLPPYLREPASLAKREVRRTFGPGDAYTGSTDTPPPRA